MGRLTARFDRVVRKVFGLVCRADRATNQMSQPGEHFGSPSVETSDRDPQGLGIVRSERVTVLGLLEQRNKLIFGSWSRCCIVAKLRRKLCYEVQKSISLDDTTFNV